MNDCATTYAGPAASQDLEIRFVGAECIVEFADGFGHVYRAHGERPSAAWAVIARQMQADRKPFDAAARQSRAA